MSTFLGLVWVAVVCSEEVVGTGVTQLSVTGEAVSGEARAPLPFGIPIAVCSTQSLVRRGEVRCDWTEQGLPGVLEVFSLPRCRS